MGARAEAVVTFSERVGALAHKRVSSKRLGDDDWELRVRPLPAIVSRGLSFEVRTVRLGGSAALLADTSLRIVRADFAKGVLRLRISPVEEARQVLAEADTTLARIDAMVAEAEQFLRRVERDPLRTTFARRALRGIRQVATDASAETIASATEAPTDMEVLIRALEQPELLSALAAPDLLLPAKLRGLRERERLLNFEGGTWDTEHVARHLHLTRQAVNRRRRVGALLAVDVGRRGYRYPSWQFVRAGTLPGLEATLAALRDHDVWMQLTFLLNSNVRLDGASPLDALRAGRREQVETAARAFGEHGAA